ncbi:MAG: alanine racemase [Candidatus Brocadiia bacterium]
MGTQARNRLNAATADALHAEPHLPAPPACRTWARVDLGALRHNLRLARRAVGRGVGIAAVVKANAYGHGAVRVARAAGHAGARALVVANAAEGVELRDAGIKAPVIIIGASLPWDAEAIVAHDLAASLSPPEMFEALRAEAGRQGRPARVHLMLDLAMRRAGLEPDHALELGARLADTPELRLEGIASHFAVADEEDAGPCREQAVRFAELVAAVRAMGLRPRWVHLANSAAILRIPDSHFNLARAGIMLYGMAGSPALDGAAPVRPVLSWHTRVVCLRGVPAGTPVGYGHTYRTPAATTLATLPVGYHDGYARAYSSNADVLLRGRRAPVVGRVSMDYITVDAGQIPDVEVGQVATLLGRDGEACIRAEELAERRGTIPYEVTCAIGQRVRRLYVATEGTA